MARVIVGYDGSAPSKRALAWALDHASARGDEIILLTVIPSAVAKSSLSHMMPAGLELPAHMGKTFEENARARLEEVILEHAAKKVKMQALVKQGDPAKAFTDAVKESGASDVVIGHKSFEQEVTPLGLIAERLVRQMPATVTVVR